jgi:DNA topoisomerase-3
MHITSVLGHLMGLDFVEPYRKWNACRPVDLFDAPVEKRVSSDPTMKNIERTLIEVEFKRDYD